MLIAFDSTQQALRAEMLLEYAEVDIDICGQGRGQATLLANRTGSAVGRRRVQDAIQLGHHRGLVVVGQVVV